MRSVLGCLAALMLAACGGASDAPGSDAGRGGVGDEVVIPSPLPFARDCSWLTHEDPELMNIFFPDTQAHYWLGVFAIPPGGELWIEGEFPHARYMSFNLYDPTLAPFDGLTDVAITPEAGSRNPFLPGADRTVTQRKYRLRVVSATAPADPAQREPNTLYAGIRGIPMSAGIIMYRIYTPDRGTSLAGNVDLPDFRYYLPGGIEMPVPDSCAFLEQTRLGLGLNAQLAALNLSALPIPLAPTDPLDWKRFHNPALTVAEVLGRAGLALLPVYDPIRQLLLDSGLQGGFMSNRDNSYVAVPINNSAGELVVIASRMPSTPATWENAPRMQPAQLRYLSLCSVDFPTQRYWDCLYDEQLSTLGASNDYIVVVSHADQRPANARPECGVAWLNWGPLSAAALILRNMLPSPDFSAAVQNITELDTEHEVMGPYYPYGGYSTRAAFEALSADPGGDAASCRPDISGLRAGFDSSR